MRDALGDTLLNDSEELRSACATTKDTPGGEELALDVASLRQVEAIDAVLWRRLGVIKHGAYDERAE